MNNNINPEIFFKKSTYWKTWKRTDPERLEIRHIKKLLQITRHKKIKLLDIACGHGRLLSQLNSEFNNIELYGVDINKNALRLAKKVAPTANLQLQSVYNMSFPDKYFDVVVIPSSFMHFSKPTRALDEALRVCKKWIFFDLSTKTSISQYLRKMELMSTSDVYENRYDKNDITALLPKKYFKWKIWGVHLLSAKLLPKTLFYYYEKLDPFIPSYILDKIGHSVFVYGKRKNN